jgi:hypothetical protein
MGTTIHQSTPGLPYDPSARIAEAEGVDVTIPARTPRTARFQARLRDGRWQVQLRVEESYDVNQVAAVLALTCKSTPADLKLTTVRRLLQRAVASGLTAPRALVKANRTCDRELVEGFRTAPREGTA